VSDFDFSQLYTVSYYPGVAFRALRYDSNYIDNGFWISDIDPEFDDDVDSDYYQSYWEEVTDTDRVIVIAIGDDLEEPVDISNLTVLESDVCSCGQIGCDWT
jgi:hypothetical protein